MKTLTKLKVVGAKFSGQLDDSFGHLCLINDIFIFENAWMSLLITQGRKIYATL